MTAPIVGTNGISCYDDGMREIEAAATTTAVKSVVVLHLRPASDHHRHHYGMLAESVETVRIAGPAAHNPTHDHVLKVWPSGAHTGGRGTHIFSAQPIVIAKHRPIDQTPRAGTIREDDIVRLVDVDGSTADYRVVRRPLADPALLPLGTIDAAYRIGA